MEVSERNLDEDEGGEWRTSVTTLNSSCLRKESVGQSLVAHICHLNECPFRRPENPILARPARAFQRVLDRTTHVASAGSPAPEYKLALAGSECAGSNPDRAKRWPACARTKCATAVDVDVDVEPVPGDGADIYGRAVRAAGLIASFERRR